MRTKTLICDDCGETMFYDSKNVCMDCDSWLCDDCIDEHEIASCVGADDAPSHEEPTLCDELGHTFQTSAIDARFVVCSRCHDVAMALAVAR